ncbi:MAG: DUF3137 domain-containing protein [Pseudomonadota bacterium]
MADPDFQLDDDIARAIADLPPEFQKFGRLYQTDLRPELLRREGERVQAAKTARNSIIGGVGVGGIGAAIGFLGFQIPQLAVLALIAGAAIAGIGSSPMRKLAGDAKAILVKPVASGFGLSFMDKPGSVPSIQDHRRVGLLPSWDRSSFEDLLTGERSGVNFEFFEARLKQRRTTTSNGRTRTKYVTVFDGQLIRFDFHKRFFGETLVTRDAGFFNRFGGRKGMDRARLEDPTFEKAFEVYTTDQVESRFLLTPDMMQSLVDLETTFHGKALRCAFSGEQMYIAVEGANLFEPGTLFKPLDNPERVRELLTDFAAVFTLIDKVSIARKNEEQSRGEAPDLA